MFLKEYWEKRKREGVEGGKGAPLKEAGQAWAQLSDQEKQKYKDMETDMRAKYQEYKLNNPNGAGEQDEEELRQ